MGTVTMEDIARLAKVSKPTVSRALSGSPLVTEETRTHILAIAEQYGYVVNRNAQKLRSKRANTVAVVLDFSSHRQNRISDPFIFNLLAGVSEALGQRSQDLLLCSPDHTSTSSLISTIRSRGADGVIFLGHGARQAEFMRLVDAEVPFVVWGAGPEDLPYCIVGSDNLLGGRLAGDYLASLGRRRYLFVGNTDHYEMELRRKGMAQALANSGHDYSMDYLRIDDFAYSTSYDAAKAMIAGFGALPDAIFASSDTAAMAFIGALREAGIEVGKDVSVVGYNDVPSAAHFFPPLTTIRADVHQGGELLVSKLMDILDGKAAPSMTLETRLILRAS